MTNTDFMESIEPDQDKLTEIREHLAHFRDLELEIEKLNTEISEKNKQLSEMIRTTLPDMFQEAGIDTLGLPAEGNYAAYDANLVAYYKAGIPKDLKKQAAAFKWLEDNGHGEMIRCQIAVSTGKGEDKIAKQIEKSLVKIGIDYDKKMSVPWTTLTAFVREQIEKHNTTPPLEILGAHVGNIVKLKKRK